MRRARTLIATLVVGLFLGGTADLAAATAFPGTKHTQSQKKKTKKHCKKHKRGKKARKRCKQPKS